MIKLHRNKRILTPIYAMLRICPMGIVALYILLGAIDGEYNAFANDSGLFSVSKDANTRQADKKAEYIPNGTPLDVNAPSTKEMARRIGTQIDQQQQGKYPIMKRSAPALGTQQSAWSNPQKSDGQVAPGIVRYAWSPAHVMKIRLRDYMTTTIEFPDWEKVKTFYVGDQYVFEVQQALPNILVLRSRNPGADTNFTVIGSSGNIYNFYVRSESWNSRKISDFTIYVEAPSPTSYWSDASQGAPRTQSGFFNNVSNPGVNQPPAHMAYNVANEMIEIPDYIRNLAFRPEDIQFNVKMYAEKESDAEIAPERIWHDGVFTYFDYGKKAASVRRAVIYQVIDGVDTMVNTRVAGEDGHLLIVEAVGDFTMRNGNKIVCVRTVAQDVPLEEGVTPKPTPIFKPETTLEKSDIPDSKQVVLQSTESKRIVEVKYTYPKRRKR